MSSPVFPLTLALYAVAAALYSASTAAPSASGSSAAPATSPARAATFARIARATLLAAFFSHAVDIGYLCVRGLHPFVNGREAASFIAWLTVGGYLLVSLKQHLPTLGAIVLPVTIVLDVAARLSPGREGPSPTAQTALTLLHIGLASVGVAIFAVAAGDSFVYLAAERDLKQPRKQRPLRRGLPPLETLDRLNRACLLLGFPVYTAAMVTGAVLLVRSGGAHRLVQPEYLMASLAWALWAGVLTLRVTAGWRGRRAAWVTLAGFGAALGVVALYWAHSLPGGAS